MPTHWDGADAVPAREGVVEDAAERIGDEDAHQRDRGRRVERGPTATAGCGASSERWVRATRSGVQRLEALVDVLHRLAAPSSSPRTRPGAAGSRAARPSAGTMLSSRGTCGFAAVFRKNFVSGSLSRPLAALLVGRAPTFVARPRRSLVVDRHLDELPRTGPCSPRSSGSPSCGTSSRRCGPGSGPDCGSRARPRFLPSAFSKSLITNGNICTIAALPEVKYVFASLFSCVEASALTQPCFLNFTSAVERLHELRIGVLHLPGVDLRDVALRHVRGVVVRHPVVGRVAVTVAVGEREDPLRLELGALREELLVRLRRRRDPGLA